MREVSEAVYRGPRSRWNLAQASSGVIAAVFRRLPGLPALPRIRIPHGRGILVSVLLVAMGLSVVAASVLLGLRQTHQVEAEAQDRLRRQFIAGIAATPVQVVNAPAPEGSAPVPVQFLPEQPAPEPGTPVAVLRIPSLGVDKVVVEGTGPAQLQSGPGHYPGTTMPGENGTFGIAGNRVTYGGPFLKLHELERGDTIQVSTAAGDFLYTVTGSKTRLPSQNASLSPGWRERLVLTTTAPSLRGDRRLVVTAALRDSTLRAQAKVEVPPPPAAAAAPAADPLDDFQLNPLGRLAAVNITPKTAAPAPPPPPAPAPAPAPPPPPPPPPPPAPAPPPPPPPAPAQMETNPAPRSQPAALPAETPSEPSPAAVHRSPNRFAPACRNGIDDDGDGLIDFRRLDGTREDPQCNGLDDEDE